MRVAELKVPPNLPGAPVSQLQGHEAPIQAVTFSADGQYCWTGSVDRTVRLWNPSRLDPAFPPPKVLPDELGNIATEHLPRALSMQTYSLTHAVADIAVDDASNTGAAAALICATGQIVTWTDVVTKSCQRKWREHTARVNAVAVVAPQVAISASYDATVRIWDMRSRSTASIQVLKEAKDSVTSVLVDGTCIRTASVDCSVRNYDIRMGIMQCDDMGSPITSITKLDTDNLAVSCLDGAIRIYNMEDGGLKSTLSGKHMAGQYGLRCCATADGNVVSGSEDGNTIIYNVAKGSASQTLLGHSKPTCAIATHPTDSSVVVTSSFEVDAAVVWAHSYVYMKW